MAELISLESIISEIASEPYFKDNPHLLDYPAMYRWGYLALGKFGRNVMVKDETIIHIENYKGLAPKNFKQLSLAVKLDVNDVHVNSSDMSVMQSSFMWKERIERWGLEDKTTFGCKDECEENYCEKTIVENFYLNQDVLCTVRYKNPVYLKIADEFLGSCDSKSLNRMNYDSRFQINIKGDFVFTNFKSGVIYLRYYGLPADENGIPMIPAIQSVEEYVEYYLKRKLLERAMWSKDAVNLQNVFQFTVTEEKNLLQNAIRDTSPINMQTIMSAIDEKRFNTSKYSVNLGKPY